MQHYYYSVRVVHIGLHGLTFNRKYVGLMRQTKRGGGIFTEVTVG